jgi:hypothetical protein
VAARDRREMRQPNRFAAAFDAALVVSFADTSEVGLE